MKSLYILLVLLIVVGGNGFAEPTELQMCGDGIVRERYVGENSYFRAVCYSDSAIKFSEQIKGKKESKKIINKWKKDGLVHCSKIPFFKQHPYIP